MLEERFPMGMQGVVSKMAQPCMSSVQASDVEEVRGHGSS